MTQEIIAQNAEQSVRMAEKIGYGYAAGGKYDGEPWAVLVVVGPAAEKLRGTLDGLADVAREFSIADDAAETAERLGVDEGTVRAARRAQANTIRREQT